ncbi:hypothetical protein HZA75_05705 [Candidatus Roizmanbacteria bacterium]|nr:hypothetical protein [Candidatus Roizmanbacteria bacterium]
MKKKLIKQRFIILAFLIGVLIFAIVAVQTPQTLFSKAAYSTKITTIPTPKFPIHGYGPNPRRLSPTKMPTPTYLSRPSDPNYLQIYVGLYIMDFTASQNTNLQPCDVTLVREIAYSCKGRTLKIYKTSDTKIYINYKLSDGTKKAILLQTGIPSIIYIPQNISFFVIGTLPLK